MLGIRGLIGGLVLVFITLSEAAFKTSEKFKTKGKFECPLEYGVFANPGNCRRFYTCNGNVPYDTPCPAPFNPSSNYRIQMQSIRDPSVVDFLTVSVGRWTKPPETLSPRRPPDDTINSGPQFLNGEPFPVVE
ncbi:chitin-binding type-2 domain-containing protein [Trichonephila inaurata madagascariensis]|uniref:Chitin-binding type-2 domain-containing protein n=1 Tax=Trichonephila inaurata madagascariensis TaxID=2747483 RepID=A0A8X6WR41_9ARAC|nr:chitin-binding type-2 domain-containing protein [Trichonephila inaurata madagascariensis]